MIFTDVLTACDLNPMYYKFIPIFIKAWKKLFPEINIHIILIADEIINELEPYREYIKLFSPIKNIPTAFIAQNIRLFYPALLDTCGGILITDMDIIPMNTSYYSESIKNIPNNKFICYRQLSCVGKNEMVICYNIALNKTWSEIFNISSIDNIIEQIQNIHNNSQYRTFIHKGYPTNWIADQLYLFKKTNIWNSKTNNLTILNDTITKFNRLDRNAMPNNNILVNNIRNKVYSDYHLLRPYNNFKQINDYIVNLL